MALGKKCGLNVKRPNEVLGFGFVRYPRSFGRKRIVISNNVVVNSTVTTPTKKQCCEIMNSDKSLLEALPQDILIRILCGVNHDDLKRLFHVSKLIREATLIAKQWHFAYCTPTKTSAFRNSIDLKDSSELDEVQAPNGPKQMRRYRSLVNGKKLADISVALFAEPDQQRWPRKEIFMEMELENRATSL